MYICLIVFVCLWPLIVACFITSYCSVFSIWTGEMSSYYGGKFNFHTVVKLWFFCTSLAYINGTRTFNYSSWLALIYNFQVIYLHMNYNKYKKKSRLAFALCLAFYSEIGWNASRGTILIIPLKFDSSHDATKTQWWVLWVCLYLSYLCYGAN